MVICLEQDRKATEQGTDDTEQTDRGAHVEGRGLHTGSSSLARLSST